MLGYTNNLYQDSSDNFASARNNSVMLPSVPRNSVNLLPGSKYFYF